MLGDTAIAVNPKDERFKSFVGKTVTIPIVGRKIKIIEDCAHAIESKYNNKHLGTFGTFGCFSFYATKNLSIGEGGMLLTDSKKLYDKARILSLHGMDKAAWNRYGKSGYRHYDVSEVGYKYNLMDLLSVIGLTQLKKLEKNSGYFQ